MLQASRLELQALQFSMVDGSMNGGWHDIDGDLTNSLLLKMTIETVIIWDDMG